MEGVAQFEIVRGPDEGGPVKPCRCDWHDPHIKTGEKAVVKGEGCGITGTNRLEPALQAGQVADGDLVGCGGEGGKPGSGSCLVGRIALEEVDEDNAVAVN